MTKTTSMYSGAALALLISSAGYAAQATPRQRDSNIARYCTSCATVQSTSRNGSRYELTVRYASGKLHTLTYDNDPGFHPGDKVRVHDGVVTRDD